MTKSESLARSQIIALKLINIFDVYAIQERIHMYRKLLNQPTEQEPIFQELILHNVFAIRTKYDLGLIQQITQELYTELTTNMTLRKFESILFQLIPELDSPKHAYLDVFGNPSGRIDENEIKINRDFWLQRMDNLTLADEIGPISRTDEKFVKQEFQNTQKKSNAIRLNILRQLFVKLHPYEIIDDAYQMAVEDVLLEYESNRYVCRFLPEGYQLSFTHNFLIPPIQDSLHAFGKKKLNIIGMHKAYSLMGTQTGCVLLISNFLEKSLKNNLAYFPDSFPRTELTLFGQHLYSVMISILFSGKELTNQFKMMNTIYPYTLSEYNIELFLKTRAEYSDYIKTDLKSMSSRTTNNDQNVGIFPENDPGRINWEISDDPNKILFVLQQDMYYKNLLSPAQDICHYALNKIPETNIELVIQFKDALATIYRELGDYTNALGLFREVRIYWEDRENNYLIFLGLKNEAFCFAKLGELSFSTHLFNQIEEILETFQDHELGPIYQNLATRHHFLRNFRKEYDYYRLALKYLPKNSQRYNEVKKGLQIIKMCKKPNSTEIDFNKVDFLYHKIHFKEYIEKYKENRDKLIPNIAEAFLNLAFDWVNEKTQDYYLESIDLAIMKSDYTQITTLIQKFDPVNNPLPFLYGSGLSHLHAHQIDQFWEILRQIDFISFTTHSDCKGLLEQEIQWSDIQNPVFREKYMITIEDQIITRVTAQGFSKSPKNSHLLPENLTSTTAQGIAIRLGYFFLAWISKEKRDNWFKTIIAQLKHTFNSSDLQLLMMFKNIFKQRRDWSNYEALILLFLELKSNLLTLQEAGDYYFYHKQDFKNAILYYKKSLELTKISPHIIERLIELYTLTEDFTSAENLVQQLSSSSFEDVQPIYSVEEWTQFIETVKNSKIRYEQITDNEIYKILRTLEFQIGQFYVHHQDFDFSILYTLFSKLVEKCLANTLGKAIYSMLTAKYHSPHQIYQSQKGRKDHFFRNFLKNPNKHSPVLGNWKNILKEYCESIPQTNQIYLDIHNYFDSDTYLTQNKLQVVVDLIICFKTERNDATHSKLFPFDDIDLKLKEIIPLLNQFLEIMGGYPKTND